MKRFLLPGSLIAILILCSIGILVTRVPMPAHLTAQTSEKSSIDDSLLRTAYALTAIADTRDGQDFAKEAIRLTDRDLDQAFAAALRQTLAAPLPPRPALRPLTERIAALKIRVASDQARLAAAGDDSDQVPVAKGQLELDQDELEAVQEELARQGGDKHAEIEQELQAHEAADHIPTQFPKVTSGDSPDTLWLQIREWFKLQDQAARLAAAQQQAAAVGAYLDGQRKRSEVPAAGGDRTGSDPGSDVARMAHLSSQRKTQTELEKRSQGIQQLTDLYQRWHALVEVRLRMALHEVLATLAWVVLILLAVVIVDLFLSRIFGRRVDQRKRRQLRVMTSIATLAVGITLILLIVFGVPTQTSTLIGLATAGITVVSKDFIVAFFGWFVLMGKNGIHAGDWVEIEGVGGEVLEIGLLRTVLLEVGNWTDRGHPTGRRVAFANKFAIEGHYFNFSTADQWLWDELVISLAPSGSPYDMAQEILAVVQHETEKEAALAEQDWARATSHYGTRPFSAKPAVDMRPSATGLGLEVHVRYITRAPQRYEVKSRLFEAIVSLLHETISTAAVKKPA